MLLLVPSGLFEGLAVEPLAIVGCQGFVSTAIQAVPKGVFLLFD